ncbi:DUF4249 domain-containing protein [Chitinophaga sp. 30R24]|uniref:DUF4249 domain-containing protein n=1 Tax=Chitinophaga sp. 30R24 TaxID=3248838 RepID=UPI003B8F943D
MHITPLGTLLTILLVACEKDINIHLPGQESQLVVEGKFESGSYPQVVLSRSMNYFSQIAPAVLENSFVHNAIVTISDGSNTMMLKEQVTGTDSNRYYTYVPDFSQGVTFKGKTSGRYALHIEADNKTYDAVTTIPPISLQLDSMWATLVRVDDRMDKVRLWVQIKDTSLVTNYARYFTRKNSEPFYPGLNSVLDDQLVNGTTFEIPVDAGVNRNEKLELDTYAFFDRGDTITIKFCNIDKATWDFWRTLDFAYNSNGNPFSSPTKVLGNVPGALGYWGGYTVTYKTIIISK